MPGTEQLRKADKRDIIATLLAPVHSTQKSGTNSHTNTPVI